MLGSKFLIWDFSTLVQEGYISENTILETGIPESCLLLVIEHVFLEFDDGKIKKSLLYMHSVINTNLTTG